MSPAATPNAAPAPVAPEGYQVCCAGKCVVMIKVGAREKLDKKATAEQKAGLAELIQRYACSGPTNIPRTKFNGAEGWFPSVKDKQIRLEAFKPWQLRAYGFCRSHQGRQTFFITGVDVSKKQNIADQAILNAAAKEAVRLNKELS